MAALSVGDAIASGFRLIRRTPWVILVWALAYILLSLPLVALVVHGMPKLVTSFSALQHTQAGQHPDLGQMLALQQQMLSLQAVSWLTSIVVHTLLVAAIYRAVLDPQARRWAYLRLGPAELWLGLVTLVLMILFMLLWIALMIPLGIGAAIAAAPSHGALSGLLIGAIAAAGLAAIVWVLLRLSLALPMSFAAGKFLFYESWALTRGHALKMFEIALGVLVVAWLLEAVVAGLALWGLFAVSGFEISALATTPPPELVRRLMPAVLLLGPVIAPLGVALMAIMFAPLADIYRQLAREDVAA